MLPVGIDPPLCCCVCFAHICYLLFNIYIYICLYNVCVSCVVVCVCLLYRCVCVATECVVLLLLVCVLFVLVFIVM